jgi:hypothetical protein
MTLSQAMYFATEVTGLVGETKKDEQALSHRDLHLSFVIESSSFSACESAAPPSISV